MRRELRLGEVGRHRRRGVRRRIDDGHGRLLVRVRVRVRANPTPTPTPTANATQVGCVCNPKHAALEKAKPKPDPAAPPSARNPPHSATYKCKVFGEANPNPDPDRNNYPLP